MSEKQLSCFYLCIVAREKGPRGVFTELVFASFEFDLKVLMLSLFFESFLCFIISTKCFSRVFRYRRWAKNLPIYLLSVCKKEKSLSFYLLALFIASIKIETLKSMGDVSIFPICAWKFSVLFQQIPFHFISFKTRHKDGIKLHGSLTTTLHLQIDLLKRKLN